MSQHCLRHHYSRIALSLLTAAACSDPSPGSSSSASGNSSSGAVNDAGNGTDAQPQPDGGLPLPPDTALIPANTLWRKSSEWYRDISAAPVAEHSAAMLAQLPKWGTTGIFQIDYSFVVLDAAGAPKVNFPPADEADSVPVPVPAKGYIEGEVAYEACNPLNDDCHLLVVDRAKGELFEVYGTRKNPNGWEGSLAWWQLNKQYPRTARGQGCTSADAAGMAITPGLIGYRETKSGNIAHALRLVLRNEYIRGTKNRDYPLVAYPATHGSTATAAPGGVPYGGRLRLKASVSDNDPRFTTPGAKAILKALHQYGMIVADGGNIPLMAESDKLLKESNPTDTWEGLLAPRDLGALQPSDFEVIGIPKDVPTGAAGWYSQRTEYEAQLKKPFGCTVIVQP
jgi:hypothetical protein